MKRWINRGKFVKNGGNGSKLLSNSLDTPLTLALTDVVMVFLRLLSINQKYSTLPYAAVVVNMFVSGSIKE